jgi:hypothetical protein
LSGDLQPLWDFFLARGLKKGENELVMELLGKLEKEMF